MASFHFCSYIPLPFSPSLCVCEERYSPLMCVPSSPTSLSLSFSFMVQLISLVLSPLPLLSPLVRLVLLDCLSFVRVVVLSQSFLVPWNWIFFPSNSSLESLDSCQLSLSACIYLFFTCPLVSCVCYTLLSSISPTGILVHHWYTHHHHSPFASCDCVFSVV